MSFHKDLILKDLKQLKNVLNLILRFIFQHPKTCFWGVFILIFLSLPIANNTHKPWAPVLLDEHGALLSAQTASDGQWRFPARKVTPERFDVCVRTFEDKRFFYHPGIDPLALGRAILLNLKNRKIVSGGSTLTMQVVRQAQGNPSRTIFQKLWEMLLSLRLELAYNKKEIMALYASTAPFGANVVGIDAAAWRWFGHSPENLSWAEAATLAVLPNQPTLINPSKRRHLLQKKRDRLLLKLLEQNILDTTLYLSALSEPLPRAPRSLPRYATHLLIQEIRQNKTPPPWTSHIDLNLQIRAEAELQRFCNSLQNNDVNHAALMIREVQSGNLVARVGNCPHNTLALSPNNEGDEVDIPSSPRSTGSLLKPFLYAQMLDRGEITPQMLIPDIPTRFGSYAPKNYDMDYRGSVPADQALSHSLNVPAVRLLHQYGSDRFLNDLHHFGLKSLNRSASAYGLSLILGGGESTLEELTMAYLMLTKLAQGQNQGLTQGQSISQSTSSTLPHLGFWAAWHTFQALEQVNRPSLEASWKNFSSARPVAWKTGTSFGFRDAWAIGSDGQYVVGVWAGNASGQGRPGLTGIDVAAPILFQIFGLLDMPPSGVWPTKPPLGGNVNNVREIELCDVSGHPANPSCPKKHKILWPNSLFKVPICPYHRTIYQDPITHEQVDSRCFPVQKMHSQVVFQLPPAQEQFYRKIHPEYISLPPWKSGCEPENTSRAASSEIEILYPMPGSRILPSKNGGQNGLFNGEVVLEAAHRQANTPLLWYIDNQFVGRTQVFHQLTLHLQSGEHFLVVMDPKGTKASREFEVIQ